MAEEVSTGGLKTFRHEKGEISKLSGEKKREIEEAYERAYERKRKEKLKRIVFWIIGLAGLILLIVLASIFAF